MNAIATALPGVVILEPKVFGDDRGFFMETYRRSEYTELGIAEALEHAIVQEVMAELARLRSDRARKADP